ncbi:GlxA family transcriptional regulator [Rhizobium oryzicola]|uniref:GlxA family transcriptional regulator n=2 Tax=Rhizobium oryzicola TaxID=1232668 RepID=A0ABT8SVS4_9HYPH|nr:GlxA family transcriptional regulator [Rhizobium oryzicola]MDO1582542.1 GlxA family transcriptional regulator [Rhizobium oryzicola]
MVVAEIALLIYPDCQLAAIYGLTDLFTIASQWAAREPDQKRLRSIRVSHWRMQDDDVACVWDSHAGEPHQITHAIAPPSLIVPEKMQAMPAASQWMSSLHAQGVTLGSVCAGAFVLAETGLINHRRATTHWAFAETLAHRFPDVRVATEKMVIDDGDIMTAGGILAWTDLGLTLVAKLLGPGVMLATARFLLIEPPRLEQRAYSMFIPKFDHGDAEILRVQHHMHAHVEGNEGIPELAARAGLAERTFMRRFAKATGLRPTEYLQHIRIMKARDALELTNRPIDQIAWSVGYSDPAAFRKTFHKITGLLPAAYRQRFGVA